MPKRTLFTNLTPLPPQVTREVAVAMLHNHNEMIELNPLVIEHHPIKTPRDAPADEFLDCVWQELTDKIHYLPGGLMKGKVCYKACFHDTPLGLQTHIYAPMGLDIREKWSVGGSLPGEPPEPRELGLDTPRNGLYLREDCDMKCNIMLTSFVRKNLDGAHKVLVERILKKAERIEQHRETMSFATQSTENQQFQSGSHMAQSTIMHSPLLNRPLSPQMMSPQQDGSYDPMGGHPAFRNDDQYRNSTSSLPPYMTQNQRFSQLPPDMQKQQLQQQFQQHQQYQQYQQYQGGAPPPKQFAVELPGSTYHTSQTEAQSPRSPPLQQSPHLQQGTQPQNRQSLASELSGSEIPRSPHLQTDSQSHSRSQSDSNTVYSEQQQAPPHGVYRYNPQDFSRSGQGDRGSTAAELPTPPMQSAPFGQQRNW